MDNEIMQIENRFIAVYGRRILEDFSEYRHVKETVFPMDMEVFNKQLEFYVNRQQDVSNFYKHRNYTRFIFITLEKYYGGSAINFSKLIDVGNRLLPNSSLPKWEIEHIIPQSCGDFKKHHQLGNLTLIPKKLNTDAAYSNKTFDSKRGTMKKFSEEVYQLHINSIFRTANNRDLEKKINEREEELKQEFRDIFFIENYFSSDSFVRKVLCSDVSASV